MKSLFIATCLLSSLAFGQMRPTPPAPYPGPDVEYRLRSLEDKVNRLEWRLTKVEQYIGQGPAPVPPPVIIEVICATSNSYNKKPFIGVGMNDVDAGYDARKACENDASTNSPAYCTGKPTCEPVYKNQPLSTCTVENSYNHKIFKANGKNRVDARYSAQRLCVQDVSTNSPAYCADETKVVCSQ